MPPPENRPAARIGRRAASLGLLAGALARPAPLRAAPPVRLTVLGYYGPFQRAFRTAIIAPFERANPDISVEYRPVTNSAQSLALLRLQRSAPDIDIAIVDIAVSLLASRENLLAPLDQAQVPNLADVPAWGRPAETRGVAFSRDNLSLVYNTALVRTAPQSWLDLARPDVEGSVCMPIADTRGVLLLPLLDRMQGADYKQTIDPALALLRHIAPNVETWAAQPDIYTLIRSGTAAIGVSWNGRGQMIGDESGGQIATVIPREGSIGQINTLNVAAGSPRMAAALAFTNYALGVEAQTAFARAAFYGPTNARVALPPALAQRIDGGPQAARNAMHLDWSFISRNYTNWVRRIQREVISD